MYGMPFSQALVFLAAVAVIVFLTQWQRLPAFLVLAVVAPTFGAIAGFTTAQLGGVFGSGFAEKVYVPGLLIVAAGFVAALAESSLASARLAAKIARWRWLGSTWLGALLGVIGGLAASPAAAFALLTPLMRAIGHAAANRQPASVALALGISASHGVALLTPVPIAAIAILDAPWDRAAQFGLPLAVLLALFGAMFARWSCNITAVLAQPAATAPPQPEAAPIAEQTKGGSATVLILAMAIPLLLLMVQSLGDIPSEPLGGGPKRELVLGVGRPLLLFLLGIGIMIAGNPRDSLRLLADAEWTKRVLGGVAGTLLAVCAAGGLQRLCQDTGMADVLGERLLDWHVGQLGILIPFLIAAIIKTLQGSSLVAAITAAGMVQPALTVLGLADDSGKALAALAVGAGAMTIAHVNDEYFWLVTTSTELPPARGLAVFSLGTLLQGLLAAAVLLTLSLLIR